MTLVWNDIPMVTLLPHRVIYLTSITATNDLHMPCGHSGHSYFVGKMYLVWNDEYMEYCFWIYPTP